MRQYTTTAQDYELDAPQGQGGQKGILLERTKTTKAGDYLECEIFPVVAMDNSNRQQRRQKSKEAMQKANAERARRKLERLLNANFREGDLLLHLTMADTCSFEDMQRLARNYIQRLKYRAKKRGAVCRYVYVIETTGEGERMRHHVHMVMNGWVDRDEAEKLWQHGLARADRAQKQEKGLAGFARYITQRKETQRRLMKRAWGASKGLKQPTVTVSDRKFSRRQAAKIAEGAATDARALFEKKYTSYRLIVDSVKVRFSDFLPGAYIYAMMERVKR